jgi:hypothetical protein
MEADDITMSMGEEAGKVAAAAVDTLKGSPGLMAVIMLNAIILGAIYFAFHDRNATDHIERIALLERCFPINRIKD